MTEYKKLYNSLLKSEDLFELDAEFTGVWEEDADRFIQLQDELEYLTETPLLGEEDGYEDEEDFD